MTKWTFGDAVKAKVRDHTSKAGFREVVVLATSREIDEEDGSRKPR